MPEISSIFRLNQSLVRYYFVSLEDMQVFMVKTHQYRQKLVKLVRSCSKADPVDQHDPKLGKLVSVTGFG